MLPHWQAKGQPAQYQNRANGNKTVVPLHNDIAEPTARAICKQLGIPPVKFN